MILPSWDIPIIIHAISLIIILALLTMLHRQRAQIRQLRFLIKKEQQRRETPFLNFIIDRQSLALRLINDGDVMVKNIEIEEITTVVDVGFQKTLTLKFKPIDQLKPGDSVLLELMILENEQPLPPGLLQRMGGLILSMSFTAYIHCKTMADIPFCLELIKNRRECTLSRIALADDSDDQ